MSKPVTEPVSKEPKRCDVCGKFRKLEDLTGMCGEYDEQWVECRWCVSGVDLDEYFNGERNPTSLEKEIVDERAN